MKKFAITTFICAYLGTLVYGNLCHALQYGTGSHPLMYYIVWDMFCGWSAYNNRTHLIAEGVSEKYYDLAPAPWGTFKPWGAYSRHNYDVLYNHSGRIAATTLNHTTHEPIARIYIVEENWAKKFDLPDHVWKLRYGDQDKTHRTYCHVKAELTPDGMTARMAPSWSGILHGGMLADNPRLKSEIARTRPMFLPSNTKQGKEMSMPGLSEASVPAIQSFGLPTP